MKRFHFFAAHRYSLCILSIFVHQKVYLIVIFFKKKVSFSDKKPVAVHLEMC